MSTSWIKRAAKHVRTVSHIALALAPSPIKLPIYRHLFGFRIAKTARIGVSILDVDELELSDGASIGHGNVLTSCERVTLGRSASIGFGNIVRGGKEVRLEDYAWVLRFNVLNSIPDAETEGPADPRIVMRPGACVVSGHRLDFTDRIELGKNVIVAGRNSSFWTHNRQQTKPITIGDYCYVGSEVRIAPGAVLAPRCILGLGAVLTKPCEQRDALVAGVPAKVVRPTTEEEQSRLRKKTRSDVPDDAY